MHTILGAGGAIANELVKVLAAKGKRVRLVGRNPRKGDGAAETRAADVSDLEQTIAAVAGSEIVYLLVGLKYDREIWADLWPRIMRNAIEASQRAGAKLIFFDNVYMYGRVQGLMTEATPFNPCSVKGEIRARVAQHLLDEIKSGKITAMIARCADFYGPNARTGIPNSLVFDKFAKKSRANWLQDDSLPHSFTFVPDAARALALLADHPQAWNQTWHMPTSQNPPMGRQFIEIAAKAFEIPPRYWVLRRPVIKIAGWFDGLTREIYEMLYQYDSEYLFDSNKFTRAFGVEPTTYEEGIRQTAHQTVLHTQSNSQ